MSVVAAAPRSRSKRPVIGHRPLWGLGLDALVMSSEWRRSDQRTERNHVWEQQIQARPVPVRAPEAPQPPPPALHKSAVVTRETLTAVRPICGICIRRLANTVDDLDGRRIYICFGCKDELVPDPPEPPLMRERILRSLGTMSEAVTISELAAAMGEDDELGRARISAALARAVRAGLVTYIGNKMDRWYALVAKKK